MKMMISEPNSPPTKIFPWDAYVRGVLEEIIPACRFIKLACQRHLDDLESSKDEKWLYRFDVGKAKRIVKFFTALQLTEGLPYPGKPFKPELWQAFIIASIFGWVKKADGLRRFRKGHITVPRKNGKSPTFAAIGLYGLAYDDEMGSQVYSAATKKDQAKIIWDHAMQFRRHSGDLAQKIDKSVNALFVRDTNSKFQALSSDEDGLDGLNVHMGLIDEFQNHKTDVAYERINTSTTSRRQPLILTTGTAGTSRESPMFREHEYAANVLTGDFHDDTYFAYLAEADQDEHGRYDDWEDEETWKRCNPNFGVSVNMENMRIEANAAKNEPAKLNSFLRLHLNIWTSSDSAWMNMDRWRQSLDKIEHKHDDGRLEVIDPRNKEAVENAMLSHWRLPFAGLDMSSKIDLTALVLLFPPVGKQKWLVLPYFFVPADCVEKRSKNDRVPYDLWIREGLITATPGQTVDYDFVKAEVLRLHHKLHFKGLGVDPWNSLMLSNQLRGDGIPVIEVQQGYKSLSDAMKELMAWVLGKKICHTNDPVLNWNMGNVSAAMDPAGNIKPDKEKSRERIDGVSALVNAVFLALSQQYSVYTDRGIVTI